MTRDIVSIEKVLNSRCSSDFDSGAKNSHWGTFITMLPSKRSISRVLHCCNIPRFSNGKLLHWFKNDYLFLGFEKPKDPYSERLLHIESGMQHEAVYLACAAQGVGTCIHNQGINGTEYGEKIATARHLIMEIADPYDSGKFTTRAPGPEKPFISGKNLTEPLRDGDIECLSQLENLATSKKSGSSATEKDISQLLWAAKGRTPHHIHKHVWNKVWGLTIPTWGGDQNYTTIYPIETTTNSTILNFAFDQPNKRISFNLSGPSETHGFCNVTIPNSLLRGNFSAHRRKPPNNNNTK